MPSHDHLMPNSGKELLREICGKKLKTVEGYHIDLLDDANRVTFSAVTRMHFADGAAYDLHATYVEIEITKGFTDDCGVLSLSKADGDIWVPVGIKPFKLNIGKTIDEAILVNDFDLLKHNGIDEGSFAFTKAVLLRSKSEYISFALDSFTEDAVVVRTGSDPSSLVPDGSGSWYEEDGWTDDYTRTFESL